MSGASMGMSETVAAEAKPAWRFIFRKVGLRGGSDGGSAHAEAAEDSTASNRPTSASRSTTPVHVASGRESPRAECPDTPRVLPRAEATASTTAPPTPAPQTMERPEVLQTHGPLPTASPLAAAGSATARGQLPLVPLEPGRRVRVQGYGEGVVQYVGYILFMGKNRVPRKRFRVGVELDRPCGLNNGTVNGNFYFRCAEKHGVFVIPCKVSAADVSDRGGQSMRRRISDNWETTSITSTFSLISMATVQSFGSDYDFSQRGTPTASPSAQLSCSTTSQGGLGGDFVVLSGAETF
mmetsp:Transcript_35183/g.92065  ORF Transcript_35183/g.92065 Transcript_35183/m.92065 type:complete len:295 (+) Transcript_35183:84-968(+)|eukprot:CAMPEP_0206310154 /NCGR_PEP_ID=MMETSP0106_2-20121207/12767_1 /ASSEMBLY_ACC=CAM_ASM_000206 /TAXON_ID=81532 /ORGANISM="Acanthoeca-like sp., Strain 10tr" /LENGTH=294 /DNA_ID=CAMNT_0053741293 /DNA_START=46 /DNA_END=930 /DNA_ORIENTATION=-